MSGSSRPDVESSILVLSSESDGIFVGWDPVARIRWSNWSVMVPAGRPRSIIERGTGERGAALHELHLPKLRDASHTGGQLVDDALLEGAQLVDVDLGLAERHAPASRRAAPRPPPSRRAAAPSRGCTRDTGTHRQGSSPRQRAPPSCRGRRHRKRRHSRPGPRQGPQPAPNRLPSADEREEEGLLDRLDDPA